MAAGSDYEDYVLEQLASVGRVRPARFFGGTGLWRDSRMFGYIANNTLYLVVDDATRPRYEALGMRAFEYDTKARRVTIQRLYELPESVLEDPDELRDWVADALAVAARKKQPAKRKRKKTAKRRS